MVKIPKVDPRDIVADIWDLHAAGHWVGITTNFGWNKNGRAVMGAGTAKQALDRFKGLDAFYGMKCRNLIKLSPSATLMSVVVKKSSRLVFFATKKLNPDSPHLSWKADSCKNQIIFSAVSLKIVLENRNITEPIYLPRPGCSNGNLDWDEVKPLIIDLVPKNVIFISK